MGADQKIRRNPFTASSLRSVLPPCGAGRQSRIQIERAEAHA